MPKFQLLLLLLLLTPAHSVAGGEAAEGKEAEGCYYGGLPARRGPPLGHQARHTEENDVAEGQGEEHPGAGGLEQGRPREELADGRPQQRLRREIAEPEADRAQQQ